jgi:hypothetical protein
MGYALTKPPSKKSTLPDDRRRGAPIIPTSQLANPVVATVSCSQIDSSTEEVQLVHSSDEIAAAFLRHSIWRKNNPIIR